MKCTGEVPQIAVSCMVRRCPCSVAQVVASPGGKQAVEVLVKDGQAKLRQLVLRLQRSPLRGRRK